MIIQAAVTQNQGRSKGVSEVSGNWSDFSF